MAIMTGTLAWHGLEVFGLDLHFSSGGPGNGFAGAAWRGLLGHALCRAVCIFSSPACASCPSAGSCAYPALFKPVDDATLPPFWLHGWQRNGGGWHLGIRWLGQRHHIVGEWLAALSKDSQECLFDGRPVRLELAMHPGSDIVAWRPDSGVLREQPLPLASHDPPPQTCRVRCITPLVSKHTGDPLYGALHTRLQRLVRQHGDGSELKRLDSPWDCKVIEQKPRRIPLARRMLSGTTWELELTAIDPTAWQMLVAGSELHAGGQTGLGCGHFVIT